MLVLEDYTRTLRPHIPLPVVSHKSFERILALTSYFPAALANNAFVIEVHLREDEPFADAFAFFPEGQLPLLPVGASEHCWQHHPTWQKIYRFFSVWCEPTSLLHEKTDQAWLSFDLNHPVPDVPIPGVFYCSTHPESDRLATIHLLADIFRTPGEMAVASEPLACCLQHIPEPARLNHVGFGLLRDCGIIRLQIVDFPPEKLLPYLEEVGWPYSTAPLQPILEQFAIGDLLSLMFDVSATIQPKIGLECMLRGYDNRWQQLLDYLVEQGLCQPEKRDFLTVYPGTKLCQMGEQVSLTRQRLSHIKIGYHPEHISAPFEAKAYLAYYPTWLLTADDESVDSTE